MQSQVLLLVGQIGSGKTTVGRRAAEAMEADFLSIEDVRSHGGDTTAAGLTAEILDRGAQAKVLFECSGTRDDFEKLVCNLDEAGQGPLVAMLTVTREEASRRVRRRPCAGPPRHGADWGRHLAWVETRLRLVPADIVLATDDLPVEETIQCLVQFWRTYPARDVGSHSRGLFSYSKLAAHAVCPKAYEYKYIERQPECREPSPLWLGSRIHEALRFLHHPKHAPGSVSETELIATFEQRIRVWEHRQPGRLVSAPTLDEGRPILLRYYHGFYETDRHRTLAVERRFAIDLGGGLVYGGRVDRVAIGPMGTLEVIDYKLRETRGTSRPWVPDQYCSA